MSKVKVMMAAVLFLLLPSVSFAGDGKEPSKIDETVREATARWLKDYCLVIKECDNRSYREVTAIDWMPTGERPKEESRKGSK